MSQTSPNQIRTLYDDTFRSRQYLQPEVASMATAPNLIGYLEHHSEDTDGSFSICLAGGLGIFVSKALWESIPEAHRPPLDTSVQPTVEFSIFGGKDQAIGSIIMPVILTNAETGVKFRIKLYSLVLPDLYLSMFIGGGSHVRTTYRGRGRHTLALGNGVKVTVEDESWNA